ncbi:MAG: tetratricopeptide repeat-containing serine protease family protein [Chamaesiphon sp.]|nr:tetratricopeptide repeat-containing serine protease family protein [Chamaesiphon sp.]
MAKLFTHTLLGISIAALHSQILPVRAIAASPSTNISDRIVLIQTRSEQGSGVIIKRIGSTYTILTAAHVVNDLRNSPLQITTSDQQRHTSAPIKVKIAPNALDLATISFQSDQNYPVAQLGDSATAVKGQPIFAVGFQGTSLKLNSGTVVATSRQSQERGYGLAIGNADILPGMSGGGLFTEAGTLIGINGKSVGTTETAPLQEETRINFKPVSGLAIPINTFKQVASSFNVDIGSPTSLSALTAVGVTADDFFITAGNKSQKGDYRGAIVDYDRALALNSQFEEIYFRRGVARTLIKDWQGAEADYTKAIATKPEYAEGYLLRGSIRNTLNNWRGAKSDFDIALTLNPNSLPAYMGRGVALCELNDCKGGLQDYNRAIALNPTYAEAYTRRGFAYYRSGNRQGAINNYMAAAELYRQQGKDRDYLETVIKIKQLVRG